MFLVTLNAGMVFGFVLSNYLKPIFIVPITCACLLFLYYSVLLSYLQDTPQYLIKIGLIDEAKKSLQFYWNSDVEDKKDIELEEYFENLRQSIEPSKLKDNLAEENSENILKILCKYSYRSMILKFTFSSFQSNRNTSRRYL